MEQTAYKYTRFSERSNSDSEKFGKISKDRDLEVLEALTVYYADILEDNFEDFEG